MSIESICRIFGVSGQFMGQAMIHAGNINKTYTAVFCGEDGVSQEYVVQKINGYVFKNPVQIMSNIDRVTRHIHHQMKLDGRDTKRLVLKFNTTPEGQNYVIDANGDVWRMYRFIPNSIAFDSTDDLKVLENAGWAFGQFQKDLLNFDASELYETIPDFHNTPKRLETLFASAEADEYDRVKDVVPELNYLRSHRDMAGYLVREAEDGTIPLRVTHNDTKCNNVLFDKDTGEALAVIDLDTIMPGLMMYDFGDAIRFAANTAAEDEPDTSRISLDLKSYTAFTKGFIGALGKNMTQEELDNMALGAFAITIELASRFLDDYLTGDKYFTTNYPGHNLVRARSQIALAQDMERKLKQMQDIVNEVARATNQ